MSKIKVIFISKESDRSQLYESPKMAYKAAYKFLEGRDDDPFIRVMYCDPLELPVTFFKAYDVPYNPLKLSKTTNFYNSQSWKKLRLEALEFYGRRCVSCGATAKNGAKLHVDHIKPKSKYPDLALDLDNLQILCEDCNLGKMADYEDDWR